jgi:hypothetical protein
LRPVILVSCARLRKPWWWTRDVIKARLFRLEGSGSPYGSGFAEAVDSVDAGDEGALDVMIG